jgi:hypothetical protein
MATSRIGGRADRPLTLFQHSATAERKGSPRAALAAVRSATTHCSCTRHGTTNRISDERIDARSGQVLISADEQREGQRERARERAREKARESERESERESGREGERERESES